MATLSDVAKKAAVSKMTVSRVINHPDQVSSELRELVYAAMKELKYVPNFAARALVHNRTQVIKLLILEEMDTTEPYYMNLLNGIAMELDKHHYALQLVTRNSHSIGDCDGLIITGMRADDYRQIIDPMDRPIVLFGQTDRAYDFVDVDNERGIRMATEHVISLHFTNILFFGISLDEPFMMARIRGFTETVLHHGLYGKVICMKNSSRAAQIEATKQLAMLQGAATAIVCASDRLAIGVVRAVLEMGLAIPRDVAVTGFDGVFLDRVSYPKLTTVRQPVIEMGQECAKMLLNKIDLDGARIGSRIFQPVLIVRESTWRP
ncbi:LacI family DNA-binding transcriptional regulator [Sporolactobacillus vineae]|uniref:LacI family DNA-binding transcriptional regulator n=1 Tax=Sporolactobacillus vineae TaxID=444463 RepID=UPI000287EDCE|nr:LacI family DNA-binding transcriptional regulator [Sporolactobacillus vineae]